MQDFSRILSTQLHIVYAGLPLRLFSANIENFFLEEMSKWQHNFIFAYVHFVKPIARTKSIYHFVRGSMIESVYVL